MTEFEDDDLLMLSGLQHFSFCRRQWALIHVEQQWAENNLTADGQMMHRKADNPFSFELRGDVLTTRAMPLVSRKLGIYGVSDVVEFHAVTADSTAQSVVLPSRTGKWIPFPVEYKRGKVKEDEWDEVQLCAQALCLEEMLSTQVQRGAIYYGAMERRAPVEFSILLRSRVQSLIVEMRQMLENGVTPNPVYQPACKSCSLQDICIPRLRSGSMSTLRQFVAQLED